MCGITGYFRTDGQPVEQSLLKSMNSKLIHRGPDSDGFFVKDEVGLAMRRLKVIDLESGNQPIFNEDRSLCIVFNGEIYNYRELRADLIKKGHRFQTQSDTEVIVHAYQEYREACVQYLIGMFAFAIYDQANRSVFIARDRLGIKPLFYHRSSGAVAFASEMKALLEVPWLKRKLNCEAVSHFLSLNYLPSPWTPLEGVEQLPPGHWMKISRSEFRIQEYWDVPHEGYIDEDESSACKKILELMHRSMERRLIADVPIGAFLSGGLDSSALVWLMKEHRHEKVKTFSVGFDHPSYDETGYAREVADYFGTDHHEIRCKPQDVMECIPKLAWHADGLIADQAMLPLYLVSKLAREHVTVCLSGDGGDEVFVGYETYRADAYHARLKSMPSWMLKNILFPLIRSLPASNQKLSFEYKAKKFIQAYDFSPEKAHYWWRTIFSDAEKENLFTTGARTQVAQLDSFSVYERSFKNAPKADFVNRCLYADMKVWLAGNNLGKVDSMSMAHSLEARVPFLDHELVEYMARLKPELKYRGGILKYLLKKVLKGNLPHSVLNRKKAGFHAPISDWFQNSLHSEVRGQFQSDNRVFDELFNKATVDSILKRHAAGQSNHAFQIWGLLILRNWLNQFIE